MELHKHAAGFCNLQWGCKIWEDIRGDQSERGEEGEGGE